MSLIEEALRRLEIPDPSRPATPASPAPHPAKEAEPAADMPTALPATETATVVASVAIAPSPPPAPTPVAVPAPAPAPRASETPSTPASWMGWIVASAGGTALVLILGLTLGALLNTRTAHAPTARPHVAPQQGAEPGSAAILAEPVRLRSKEPATPSLELNGVVAGVGEPLIIVNGRMVRLGESIEGATLVEISDGSARFRWKDRDLVVRTTR